MAGNGTETTKPKLTPQERMAKARAVAAANRAARKAAQAEGGDASGGPTQSVASATTSVKGGDAPDTVHPAPDHGAPATTPAKGGDAVPHSASEAKRLLIQKSPYEFPARMGSKGLMPTPAELQQMQEIILVLAQAGALQADMTKTQALAVCVKGWELDLMPVQSIEGLYIAKDGTFGLRADLMRALIQRSGLGLIVPTALTNERAAVQGIRYGVGGRPDHTLAMDFTLEEATRQGMLASEQFRLHPKGSLFARATGEMARALFSDVLRGASYVPEELGAGITVQSRREAIPTQPPSPPASEAQSGPGAQAAALSQGIADSATGESAALSIAAAPPPPPPPAEMSPPQSPAAGPSSGRLLTHSFQVPGKTGGLETIRTGGLTQETLEELVRRSKLPGVRPQIEAFKTARGVATVREFTEQEGLECLIALGAEVPSATLPPPPAPERTAMDDLRDLSIAVDVPLETLERIIKKSYGTEGALAPDQVARAIRDIQQLAKDPASFKHLVAEAEGMVRG